MSAINLGVYDVIFRKVLGVALMAAPVMPALAYHSTAAYDVGSQADAEG